MKKTDAPHLIPCFNEIFATFGLPKKVISDNGPPIKSKEIKTFMDDNDIKLNTKQSLHYGHKQMKAKLS
jgi:hypothetical protein